MKLEYAHAFSMDEVARRLNAVSEKMREKYADKVSGVQQAWNESSTVLDFSFKVACFSVSGQMHVLKDKVVCEVSLPWAAYPFKGRLEEAVNKAMEEVLASGSQPSV